jgi:D-sedoheptulose 7-phosphate isomerase
MIEKIHAEIEKSIEVKLAVLNDRFLLKRIEQAIFLIKDTLINGGRIFFAGNGGSAADSQHLAAEFISKLEFDRAPLPALALSADTSMLTAIGNDYGFDRVFVRQLIGQSKPGDVFIGITTSGKSKNIINSFNACKQLGLKSVAFCGAQGVEGCSIDISLNIPSNNVARIQEAHIMIGHIICGSVERVMFNAV